MTTNHYEVKTATFISDGSTRGTTLLWSEALQCFFAIDHENGDRVTRHAAIAAVRCDWTDLDQSRFVAGDSEEDVAYIDVTGLDLPSDLPETAEVLWLSRGDS